MQITIVQSEIETAIRDYIGQQMTIKEGMQIDIVLRSTRGDEGYTANIDITPVKAADVSAAKQTSQPVSLVKKESKAESINTGVATTSVAVKRENPDTKEVLPESGDSTGGATAGVVEAGTVQTAGEQALNEAATPISAEVPAEQLGGDPKPPTRSLFSSLKKPVNA